MPLSPMPPANPAAGAPSPRDQLADHLNRNNFIPMWLHPELAKGIIRHYGKDGSAFVHPHPAAGYVGGGIVSPSPSPEVGMGGPRVGVGQPRAGVGGDPRIAGAASPRGFAGGVPRAGMNRGPLTGIRPTESVFAGGPVGTRGPAQRPPIFAQEGRVMDGRSGTGRVPGREVPATQKQGHDTVHAMLDPGELVANQKQLKGIQIKPGKAHLLRADQKRAIKQAGKRNASRK